MLRLAVVFAAILVAYSATQKDTRVKVDLNTATEMYLYGWPLVMSSLTRKSMFYLPPNIMLPLPVFPNPNLTAIVKPNVDTLYDACWIDHTRVDELTLDVPDTTDGLYFLFPLMDAWTNIVASPGWRTTGKGATKVLIRGPFVNSSNPVSDEYDLVINSPTSMTYLLGRTNVADQNNLKPTQEQLFSYRLTKNTADSDKADIAKPVGKSNPKDEIFNMTARDFFNTFAELMITNPPILPQDADIVSRMSSEYGLVAGQAWEYNSLSAVQKKELSDGLTAGIKLMFSYPITRVNGWAMPDMATGNFSTDYYLRAYIGLVLYAANVPQDAVYYETELMTGGSDKVYEIFFTADQLPPANEFWSITMYSDQGYLVPNENGTYSVSSQQHLKYRDDGSLHVTISMAQPSDVTTTNWLPAPQAGEDFSLTMRIYWPQESVLDATWAPPVVSDVSTKKK